MRKDKVQVRYLVLNICTCDLASRLRPFSKVGTDGAWIAADLPAVRSFLKTMEAGGYFHKIR